MSRKMMTWPQLRRGLLTHIHRPASPGMMRESVALFEEIAGGPVASRPLSSARF